MINVTVYGKPGCHLCEAMLQMIERLHADAEFQLTARNILENPTDLKRYHKRIPVLRIDGKEVADFRIDGRDFLAALSNGTSERRKMLQKITVFVMAKYPEAGKVKTRLMTKLAGQQSARAHEEFLCHLMTRLACLNFDNLIVCHDPPSAGERMRALVAPLCPSANFSPQAPGDLGTRIREAASGQERVLFLGVDSPDIPELSLLHAGFLLQKHDVVLGPTEDGGFWCLGMSNRVDPNQLLSEIAWSSGKEFGQTLHRARSLGYNVGLADGWSDVDRPEDLAKLIARLRSSNDPHDQQLLRRLSFLPHEVIS